MSRTVSRTGGRGRHTRWLFVVLGTLVALAGCGGLGSTSPVRPGLAVDGAEVAQVRLVFPGPGPGATPEQIIRGFLRSGATSGGDYTTARSYLTADAAKSWQPDDAMTIFSSESELVLTPIDAASATLTAPLVAQIDGHGRYAAGEAGHRVSATVRFAKVGGEWRIAGLPEGFGRWIANAEVRRLLRPYAVHYVLADRRALAEDVRWFPLDHLTSRLARAQLDPVPTDLTGVVTTGVPAGSRLAADSVSVTAGVATVELSARVPADQTVRQNLWAQFVATLTQDPTVTAVALRADGAAIDLPGVAAPVSDQAQVGFQPSTLGGQGLVLARRGEALVPFDPLVAIAGREPSSEPSLNPELPTIPQSWMGLAESADGREFAAVSRDRAMLSRWRGKERFEVPGALGGGLADPTYDPRGYLWIGGSAGTGGEGASPVATVNPAENPQTAVPRSVAASWLVGRTIRSLRVSPDGARVAVLSVGRDGDQWLNVAGIQRGPAGLPTALTPPTALGAGRTGLVGLAWIDTTTLATLAPNSAGPDQTPILLSLDGTTTTLPSVAAGLGLTTPGGERQLVVRSASDQLLVRSGQLWVSAGPGTDVLVPGR